MNIDEAIKILTDDERGEEALIELARTDGVSNG